MRTTEDKWFASVLALSLSSVVALACVWQLWLEEPFARLVGILYDTTYENRTAWWFILQCSLFAGLGLFPGAYVARRYLQRLSASIEAEQSARRRAEEAARTKMRFLANMSHELRTPLNAIIGFSEVKLASSCSREQQREYTEIIHKAGQHLLDIVNDVLDIARSEEGRLNLNPEDFDIWRVLEDAVEINTAQACQNHVALVMPRTRPPLRVHADSQRAQQAVSNLISNAVKFTNPGGQVLVSATAANALALVEIRDNGIGIAAGDLERILRPFEQVDNSLTRKFEGTGLGLPLVKRFVEAMGGSLELESEPGNGTCARFSLPLAPARKAKALPERPAAPIRAGALLAEPA